MTFENSREMNNGKRRRNGKPVGYEPTPENRVPAQYKHRGNHKCRCGRTISANKAECLGCAETA